MRFGWDPRSEPPSLVFPAPLAALWGVRYRCNRFGFYTFKNRTLRIKEKEAYLVCFIIQAIFSVVQWEAAIIRSPSFSLPSSSITTKNSPRAKASRASSIESKSNLSVWPFVFAGRPVFVDFKIDDDRGPDMTSLCLKSATGAITKSTVSFGWRGEGRRVDGRSEIGRQQT